MAPVTTTDSATAAGDGAVRQLLVRHVLRRDQNTFRESRSVILAIRMLLIIIPAAWLNGHSLIRHIILQTKSNCFVSLGLEETAVRYVRGSQPK